LVNQIGDVLPEVPKIDEFIFVLLAGVILIFILMIVWTTPTELIPIVEPKSVSLNVLEGRTTTFDLLFNGTSTSINLTASGEIKNWLTFSKSTFDLKGVTTVKVTVEVPEGKAPGAYKGSINIETSGGGKGVAVTVNVLEMTEEVLKRQIPLGDFTVKYTSGMDELDKKSSVTVTNGYFGQQEVTLIGILPEDKLSIVTDGYVQLIVEETNSVGNLIVVFNGEEIYNQPADLGEVLVPIDKELFKRSNSVVIKGGSPGWQFWASTTYKFRTARLVVNYKGVFSKEATFELTKNEVDNFKDFHLFYTVYPPPSPILPSLMIKINSQIVFWEVPEILYFDHRFEKDMFGNDIFLAEGNNTISLSFDSEATYSVTGAVLEVETYRYV